MAGIWKMAVTVLAAVIPIPVFVILAVAAWLWLDTGSRVRLAVDKAVTELVAGAEISALEARLAAEQQMRTFAEGQREEARRISQEAQAARADFEQDLIKAKQDNETYQHEIEKLRANPRAPVADDPYVDGMRDR